MLDSLPIRLSMYGSYKHSAGYIRDVTEKIGATWKRSIRSIGGYWVGICNWSGSRGEMDDLFLNGLTNEIKESVGGLVTWEGFIAEMEYKTRGLKFTRSWGNLANRVKTVYSKIGTNQFTDGSAESAAWTAYGTPTTREKSTAWASDGTYSCHLVADAIGDGATIQAGITIVALTPYQCRVTVNIVSGTWWLEIYREDTGDTLGWAESGVVGQNIMYATIADNNAFAGNVGVRLYCVTATGEIYGDAGVFQEAPNRAETKWYADASSQRDYGVIELMLLEAGMPDTHAKALAQTELAERAWPSAQPSDTFEETLDIAASEDQLKITVYGYVFTLRNKYTLVTGAAAASTHITNILAASEFCTSNYIKANTLSVEIDDRTGIRHWEAIRDITKAGDENGNRWECGVYNGRKFDYLAASTNVQAYIRDGRAYNILGGILDPWLARPGYVRIDDMPLGPQIASSYALDDQRVFYMEEAEFDAASWLKTGRGIKWKKESKRT